MAKRKASITPEQELNELMAKNDQQLIDELVESGEIIAEEIVDEINVPVEEVAAAPKQEKVKNSRFVGLPFNDENRAHFAPLLPTPEVLNAKGYCIKPIKDGFCVKRPDNKNLYTVHDCKIGLDGVARYDVSLNTVKKDNISEEDMPRLRKDNYPFPAITRLSLKDAVKFIKDYLDVLSA